MQKQDLLGGLARGTKIFDSNGNLIPVEEIREGSLVLSSDGSFSRVAAVHSEVAKVISVTQATKHYAHLWDDKRAPPWGLIRIKCAERQRMHFKTKQRIKRAKKNSNDNTVVEITQLREYITEDGRKINTLVTTSRQFPDSCLSDTIQSFIDSVRSVTGFIEWDGELGDLKYLNKAIRASTRLVLAPLSLEKPVLLPWLEENFKRQVSCKELEAMAWLLGFWMGDGHRRGAVFSLHSEDHDVNGRLKANAGAWGMKLRIKLRDADDGYKADGYLHTFDGELRHWNANNPLVKVLEGLMFYHNGRRNGEKSIPLFMRLEPRGVRETFMAGIIDSDGSVNVQDHCIRVKVPTAYPRIRDGFLIIGRSLGLNVSVHFHHERDNPRGYHENDTWIFHFFGGSNHDILWSILGRCSCERKRNPPLQHTLTRDIEEFESDEEVPQLTVDSKVISTEEIQSIENASEITFGREKGLPLKESEEGCHQVIRERRTKINTEFDEYDEYDEGENDEELQAATISFNVSPESNEQVFEILLEKNDHQTLVSEDQLLCYAAQHFTKQNASNVDYKRICSSCKADFSSMWYKLPWEIASPERLCIRCYNQYSRSKIRCSDCRKICSKTVIQQRSKREQKISRMVNDGTYVEGYTCDDCDGVLVQYGEQKNSPLVSDMLRPGRCYSCDVQEAKSWRKVPWDSSSNWCGTCRSRFGGTATICTNESCRKVPFKSELKKMEIIDEALGHYRCLKCRSIAKKDTSKHCRELKKLEDRPGTCYSCGPTTSKRWSSLPWDKKAKAEICQTCYILFRAYKERCLNPDCSRIFKKVDIAKMKKLKPIIGPSGSCAKCRPCIICQGMTTIV